MVCFSFMVDGLEDAWLFISVQKVELTVFNKNLGGGRAAHGSHYEHSGRMLFCLSRTQTAGSNSIATPGPRLLRPTRAWRRPGTFTPSVACWEPRRSRLGHSARGRAYGLGAAGFSPAGRGDNGRVAPQRRQGSVC